MHPKNERENKEFVVFVEFKQKQQNDYCIQFMKWTVQFDYDPFLTVLLCSFFIRITKISIKLSPFLWNRDE